MQKNFSYPLKLEDIKQSVQKYKLKASKEDLAYIAEVMKVPAVKSFTSEINVQLHGKERIINVWGTIHAEIEHVSVISLECFVRPYDIDFAMKFDTSSQSAKQVAEFDIEDEIVDSLKDGGIDLGAIALEQLALELDDFPRQEGEVFNFKSEFDEETTANANPFSILKKIKK